MKNYYRVNNLWNRLWKSLMIVTAIQLSIQAQTVNFTGIVDGSLANPYNDPSGFSFLGAYSSTNTADALAVMTASSNKVLRNGNFNSKISITKTGGGNFNFVSFKYASDPWGGLSDAVITGTLAAGGTVTATVTGTSTTLQTATLNWSNVSQVVIDYNAGVNSAYGMSDDFVFSSVDTQAPSVPSGLSSASVSQTSFTLNWAASTDNVGVTGYEVFRNGVSIGTPTSTTFNVTGLTASTAYSLTVRARDAAGNWSAQSTALSVTTQSAVSTSTINFTGIADGSLANPYIDPSGYSFSGAFTTSNLADALAVMTASSNKVLRNGNFNSKITITKTGGGNFNFVSFKYASDPWGGLSDAVITGTLAAGGTITATVTGTSTTLQTATLNWSNVSQVVIDYNAGVNAAYGMSDDYVLSSSSSSADTQAPSVPSGLSSVSVSQTSFTLNWAASTDNVGVTGYEVFRNGESIGTPTATTFNVTGLTASTAYSLTVRARDAAGNWSAQSSALSVTTSANVPTTRVNSIGMNTGNPGIDYNLDKPFADAMRAHRYWTKIGNNNRANLDSDYWPTEDGTCLVYAGLNSKNNHGTYKLSFTGQATVTSSDATVSNMTYNSSTNTSNADVIISSSQNSTLYLTFTNTKRTSTSANGTGVTNVKLMRPIAPGSTQSYPTTKIFNDDFIAQLAPFKCVRSLGWVAVNWNGDSLWSDRTLWTHATQSPPIPSNRTYGWEGRGASWESLIMFINETGKDVWITIPHKVTEDYIQNLANLLKNGNQHTPGLRTDVKLYVEYSNEIWNWQFSQTVWTRDQSISPNAPSFITFDGVTDPNVLMHRLRAVKTVKMSEIFRSVFGDADMMTRVRPVFCWQRAYNDLTARALNFVDRWYNKHDSRSTVTTARPVNYYIYGGGGSGYWYPAQNITLTESNLWTTGDYDPAVYYNNQANDAGWAKAFGLAYLAYEGDHHPWFNGDEVLMRNLHWDPRMNSETYEKLQIWNQVDGELFNFLSLNGSSPVDWAVRNVDNPANSPQLDAINNFNDDTPLAVTLGSVVPFTRPGGSYDILTWENRNPNGTGSLTLTANNERFASAYNFRTNATGTCNVRIQYSSTSACRLIVEFQGNAIGDFNLPSTGGASAFTSFMNINCNYDKLYSIRVVAASGSISIQNVIVGSGSARIDNDEVENNASVAVFPNPAKDLISVIIPNSQTTSKITILDLLGNIVKVTYAEGTAQIPISELSKGMYVVKVQTNEKITSCKVVVE